MDPLWTEAARGGKHSTVQLTLSEVAGSVADSVGVGTLHKPGIINS
jgi:hypothetical protein